MNDTLQILKKRCLRQQQYIYWYRAFTCFSYFAIPGLLILLCSLFFFRYIVYISIPLSPTLIIICLISIILSFQYRKQWHIPLWHVSAWLDQHSAAKGQILKTLETEETLTTIPTQAIHLPFPSLWNKKYLSAWGILLLSYALYLYLPAPLSPEIDSKKTYIPHIIQKTEDLLQTLKQLKPENKDFLTIAKQIVEQLKQQKGLQKQDFSTLEHIQQQTQAKITKAMAKKQAQAASELLPVLKDIAQNASTSLTPSDNTIVKQLQQVKSNTHNLALQTLLQQSLQQLQTISSNDSNNNPSHPLSQQQKQAARQAALKQLQQQLQAYQQATQQELATSTTSLSSGIPAASPGAGHAPLKFSHLNFQRQNQQYDNQSFHTPFIEKTLLIGTTKGKQAESGHPDSVQTTQKPLDSTNNTLYWQKHLIPEQRKVLEDYFKYYEQP